MTTTTTSTNDRLVQILKIIAFRTEAARKRAEQIQGYFQNRASTSFLYAVEAIRASELRELAEDEIYQELQASVAKAKEMSDDGQLTPAQTFELVVRFTERLASAARRAVEADSSSFMSNALAVARHNAVLGVLEFLWGGIEEARKEVQS